ncbi:VWA domain-containing protein [Paenibacillus macerans]|uniref:VWA domain-containing protein n=1 Tax=Paenibacillus macerans TaxID=44252 RepID=UPI0020413B73|nr:VWA domain-containing protein [Paenibacillus macerans]MCM3701632.1 VWA domain-containing protein [Paenibacillus macerans]
MCSEAYVYPFCAVVGQEPAKKALLLHAVNPSLKGVLLAGEAGTAKTTLVRGLAALLSERKQIGIPLHVDNERLFGGVETAAAVRFGERRFAPGLLAAADGQLVTIDDVNLMSERTLHAILSAAEHGGFETEREGGGDWQPASFLLLGTINPEEAKLKPALLDRFGLYVRAGTSADPAERAEIIRRRLAFERNPERFAGFFEPAAAELREKLAQARRRLSAVRIGEPMLRLAAEIAAEAGCPGQRANILLAELARTLAAWEGQTEIEPGHLREAAGFVLPHRMRPSEADTAPGEAPEREPERDSADGGRASAGPPKTSDHSGRGQEGGRQADGPPAEAEGGEAAEPKPAQPGDAAGGGSASGEADVPSVAARAVVETVGRDFDVRRIAFTPPRVRYQAKAGKRNQAGESGRTGRYVRAATSRGAISDLALDATLRAAAPYQFARRRRQPSAGGEDGPRPGVLVERSDLRVKVRESRTGTALLFVVDASGSMNAAKRMKAVKGAVLSLLRDAYRQRDSVGLIAFRDKGAELLLDITRSVELAERRLKSMPVGGKTPLLAGLEKGAATIRTMLRKGSGPIPAMIVITDGKANAGIAPGLDPWQEIGRAGRRISEAGIQTLVIDTEQGFVRLGYARKLADGLQAQYFRLEELDAGRIERAVRNLVQSGPGKRRVYSDTYEEMRD